MRESSEHEVVQDRIMQHHDARRCKSLRVDFLVQAVVAQMIEMNIGVAASAFERCADGGAQASEQRLGIIGDAAG